MESVVATLWIHRAEASTIIVYCQSNEEAYVIASKLLYLYKDSVISPWDFSTFPDPIYMGKCLHVGNSPDMQLSIHPDTYMPPSYWNARGTAIVSPEEAIRLGAFEEPAGFEPYESLLPWRRETRSHAELDKELDEYFHRNELEVKHLHYRILTYAGMFGEFNLTEILSCNDINTLKSEIDSVEYEYYRMTEEEQRLTDKTTRQLQGYFLGTTS